MYSETLPKDFLSIRIILRFAQVKPHVETKLGRQIDHFDPKSYKSQVPTYLVYLDKQYWAWLPYLLKVFWSKATYFFAQFYQFKIATKFTKTGIF